LRRASPVARYLAAASTEAIGGREFKRLAVVVSCYTGSVNYSSRFYGEVLEEPGTASPILFPETVFNAPSSHLSALFGSDLVNHTLVGDESAFATALDLAARWLVDGEADAVLVAAGEESDPLTSGALALRQDAPIVGEGAAALVLERSDAAKVELSAVSDPITYRQTLRRRDAVAQVIASCQPVFEDRTVDLFGDCFGATPAIALVGGAATLAPGESLHLPIVGKNLAAARVTLSRQSE
jgi:hypothetical protein